MDSSDILKAIEITLLAEGGFYLIKYWAYNLMKNESLRYSNEIRLSDESIKARERDEIFKIMKGSFLLPTPVDLFVFYRTIVKNL